MSAPVPLEYMEDTGEEYPVQLASDMRREMSIPELESRLLCLPQVDCPVIHRFGPGVYIREVTLPAGAIIIGHRQKTEHMNVFLKGRLTMLNDDGSMTDMSAPMIFTAGPGRKCGYVHEDVVWLNIYPTEERDVETLESTYLDKSMEWTEFNERREKMISAGMMDRGDFIRMLSDLGVSGEQMREESECVDDLIPMPLGDYKIMISKSRIEGKGVFATAGIEPGEVIAPARIGRKRTPVGRYTNHAASPNARMEAMGDDVYLVATKAIRGCRGGFLGDEITTDYRDTIKMLGGTKPCQE